MKTFSGQTNASTKIIQCKGVKGFSFSGFDLLFDQNESKRTKQ